MSRDSLINRHAQEVLVRGGSQLSPQQVEAKPFDWMPVWWYDDDENGRKKAKEGWRRT